MRKYISGNLRFLTVIALAALHYQNLHSQEKKHETSIAVGGVTSFASYDLEGGSVSRGDGGSISLRYAYYLNSNWSVGVGAEYQSYNAAASFSTLSGHYMTTDAEQESFEFRYSATNVREEQRLRYVNIPATVQYESSGLTRFYVLAGGKIGFATSGSYTTSADNVTTSGFYPQYNAELFGPAFAGFGSVDAVVSGEQELDVKISYSLTAETGIKQDLGGTSSIYIGIYFDYGLNSIYKKSADKNLVVYPEGLPVKLQYNSVLDTPFAGDVKLMAFGVRLRFAIR